MTYYNPSEVRAILLGDADNSEYDEFITQEGPFADKDVENDLFAYSGVNPPYTGANITDDLSGAANWRTAARVFGILAQLERKKDANEEYKSVIDRMVARFKATPTTRTTTVSVTTDYRASPLSDE